LYEEVLLSVRTVVKTPGLAGLEDADVDPELLEPRLALEDCPRAELLVLEPAGLLRIDDEPTVVFGD
jgi:hypothetical protein